MTDLSLIRIESERAKDQLAIQVLRAAAFVVYDEDSFKLAEHHIKEVKAIAHALKEKRDEITKPAKAIVKIATDDVKPRLDTADEIEEILKGKCLEYRRNQHALRAKAEAEAQRLLASINTPVEEKRAALVAVANAVVPVTSGVSYRKTWKGTVTHPELVPAKYWTKPEISQAAIDLDVASGTREIPGVEIKQHESMSVGFRK